MRFLRTHPASLAAPLAAALCAVGAAAAVAPSASAASGSCQVAAAGDIAGDDYQTGAARTADLITSAHPDRVIAVGDLAYDSGTVREFQDYYVPTWGAFTADTEAVPGNHEGANSAGYRKVFGAGQLADRGVDVCGWRVILINQYAGVSKGAAFITSDAAAHPDQPVMVVWHEPRYSSGVEHGSNPAVQPLWAAATTAGARIVLNGHDHDYERFEPMSASGATSDTGTRQFVTGLGGHHIRGWGSTAAHSAKRFTGTPSVLFLTLDADGSYSWAERTASGTTVDSGTADAPGGQSGPTPQPTSTSTSSPTSSPTSKPTSTSSPTSSPTSKPTSTSTSSPTSSPTSKPTSTSSPTSSPTSKPTSTSSPTSSPTSKPTSTSSPTSEPTLASLPTGTPLRVSEHSDRSESEVVPRDGSLVVSGKVYFYVPTTATKQVRFGLDSRAVRTESHRPFDAMGTGSSPLHLAKPLDTTELANGEHTIVVDGVRPDRASTEYTFTVDN